MADFIRIDERISYIPATENPLSADVGIIEGDGFFWIFDVGADISVPMDVNRLGKPKKVIISHFHPDHSGNIERLDADEIFLGRNTLRYIGKGIPVEEEISFDDGISIRIFPLPSSHAKGSVGLLAGEYAFLGDATYSTMKQGKVCYNSSVLGEEISVLKNLPAKYFLISHDEKFIRPKEEIIAELQEIYSKRSPKESFIWI